MRKIRIISGSYGHKNGALIDVKDRTSAPFDVSDKEAERLCSLNVAEYADEGVEGNVEEVATLGENILNNNSGNLPPVVETPKNVAENVCEENAESDGDVPNYKGAKVSELREIAKKVGLSFKVGTTKEEMVAALDAYYYEDVEDDSETPDMSAANPVV